MCVVQKKYKMMVASLILFLITTVMAKRKHHHSKDPNEHFFGTIYVAIHSVVDDIFESFNLSTNFTNAKNSKLLLTMHNDLSNIADKTFETFNDIQKTVRDNVNNQSDTKYLPKRIVEDGIKLDTIVKDILNQNNFNAYNAIKGTPYNRAKDETKTKRVKRRKIKLNPAFDESVEFTQFVINFLTKVNNLTTQNFGRSSRHGRIVVPSKKNLKVWDESSSLKYDLDSSDDTRRIFKGSNMRLKSFPFIVSIHIMGEFYCSGCIISRDFVITAASCLKIAYKTDFFKRNLKSIYVRLASGHTSRDGETIPVQNVYFHPGYEPEHFVNNLAIIRLEERIRFPKQQLRIRRILWDKTPGALSNDTKNILILGWGPTKEDQSTHELPKLRVSQLDVYNTDVCRQKYPEGLIRKENFCAALNGVSGGACSGDAGGPGIVGAVLVGVVSFGVKECGAAGSPTVFTKLGYYVQWIESVVNADHKMNETSYDEIDTRRKNKGSKRFNVDRSAKNGPFHSRLDDYPEDVNDFRDTLMDFAKSDRDVIRDAIYGDNYDEFSKFFDNQYLKKEEDPNVSLYPDDTDTESQIKINVEFDVETSTESEETNTQNMYFPMLSKKNIARKLPTHPEYETDKHARVDYTDNYEELSKDKHSLSLEFPNSIKKKKALENKMLVSIESESSSDKSNDYNEEMKDFFIKNMKHLQNRNSKKKYKQKSFYLSGARFDNDNLVDASSTDKEKEIPKKVVKTKYPYNGLSRHASSVLDVGKSFATKKVSSFNYDNHEHQKSSQNKAKSSSSKKRKDSVIIRHF